MIPHPFGAEKKRLLSLLPADTDAPSLHALFPELSFQDVDTRGGRLRTVVSQHLVEGDRSAQMIAGAQAELERLGIWERPGEGSAFVIEEMRDGRRAATFLAGHYYRFAMFGWFWQMYDRVRDQTTPHLRSMALDVACFDGKSVVDIQRHFNDCLEVARNRATRQRLWNKMGVLFAYRDEYEEAQLALETALALLPEVPHDGERLCRMAEWHNANALIFYRMRNWSEAMAELERGEERLAGMDDCARAQSIQALLDANRDKLLRKAQEGVVPT
ncbi:MAG: hypothetical protein WCC10_11350 [Tumebacillaceae bacterium]